MAARPDAVDHRGSMTCPECGAKVKGDEAKCFYCGASPRAESTLTPQATKPVYLSPVRESGRAADNHVSGGWWLLVVLLGWIGGLIAWLTHKDRNPVKARAMLTTGIVLTVAEVALLVLMWVVALALGVFSFDSLQELIRNLR